MAKLKYSLEIIIMYLIICYIFLAFCWTTNFNFPYKYEINTYSKKLFLSIGIEQAWDMFGPDPLSINCYIKYKITNKNGEVIERNFKKMSDMSGFEQFKNGRWRKFTCDFLRVDEFSFLWPDFSNWILREEKKMDPQNFQPSKIELIRRFNFINAGNYPLTEKWNEYMFYSKNIN